MSKVQMVTKLFLQICLHLYAPAVELFLSYPSVEVTNHDVFSRYTTKESTATKYAETSRKNGVDARHGDSRQAIQTWRPAATEDKPVTNRAVGGRDAKSSNSSPHVGMEASGVDVQYFNLDGAAVDIERNNLIEA